MKNELVSVISPCYNVGRYVARLLESLLAQSYKNLEIILVNDGSTDNTSEIIQAYIPRLEGEGYRVIYVEQENGGQSCAVNNALKLVTGAYLAWPDADDWLTPDSIEKRVCFLQSHPEVGLVRGNVERISASDGCSLGYMEPRNDKAVLLLSFFELLLLEKTWYPPVTCMVRMSCFDQVVHNREIYVSHKAGQNWQLMLPVAYRYPCWQMPEVLGFYCEREDSHSKDQLSLEKRLAYIDMCEEVILNTLSKMNADSVYQRRVSARYALIRFVTSRRAGGKFLLVLRLYWNAIRLAGTTRVRLVLTRCLITPNCLVALKKKK